MEGLVQALISSWKNESGNVNSTEEIMQWIDMLNKTTEVDVKQCSINESSFWFYDDHNGEILNRKRSFFSIKGMRLFKDKKFIEEQPIIVQPEIGYLGIICRMINGELNFLMQAKIEPGNINCVQISPTIQATKSNFMRVHGGNLPTYFDLFEDSDKYDVIYDQIQSEQSARFYKKRNRNIIMIVDEVFPIHPNYKWMTLGQIKRLLEIDNLVNMDTRTVLSGIPLITSMLNDTEKEKIKRNFNDLAMYRSMFETEVQTYMPNLFQKINNYKMFKEITIATVPLAQLVDWSVDEFGVTSNKEADFEVCFYDISISGREVQHWSQPLFKAIGMSTFALIMREENNVKEFLVKLKPEIGCFDKIEIGPSIQWRPSHLHTEDNVVDNAFRKIVNDKDNIVNEVVLSEEGGRFYHEQNYNYIVEDKNGLLKKIPDDYIWISYSVLNFLIQTNNNINIQLRNLLSLIRIV